MNSNNLVSIQRKALGELYRIVKNNFPFLNKMELLKFREQHNTLLKLLKKENLNDIDFFINIEYLLASLKNSHTKLGAYPTKVFYKPRNSEVKLISNNFHLILNGKYVGELLMVDGKKPRQLLQENMMRISSGSNDYRICQALKWILVSRNATPAKVEVLIKKHRKLLSLPRRIPEVVKESYIKIINLSNRYSYIKISHWQPNEKFEKQLITLVQRLVKSKTRAIIIDVRGNGGGSSRVSGILAAHFFTERKLFSITKRRMSPPSFKLKIIRSYLEPLKPYLTMPIILLVDSECLSSNEYFIAGLKDNKRAFVIGETTGGGSGNPKKFFIPYGKTSFELIVSTWQYFRPNGQLLEGSGIKPHIIIKPNLEDIKQDKDVVLGRALKEAKKLSNI